MATPNERIDILSFVIISIGMVVGATVTGVIIEWCGMIWFWPEQGAQHALKMVIDEAGYLNADFVNAALFGWTPTEAIHYITQAVTGSPMGPDVLDPARYRWLTTWSASMKVFEQYLLAAIYISIVCLIRAVILLFSLPLYGLFMFVAFFDGLMLRDLRKYGGARESGLRHHYAKRMILPCMWCGWGLYLAIPFTIHPNWILVPSAVLSSVSLWLAVRFFKKHL
ncbi:DUF4400 domain-containing protein (plasmid) [Aeromonas media]|uniref:DUF4400 domain-containing protein n=2 Tax=Aeromonas TaxID=642 RepID=A0ABX6NZY2_AERME|nr:MULTISPECIES: DUF4400 domain-containing protein [Aeromonas]ASI21390.1 hypothetical protein CE456_00675 [Aeromonas salmonicida]QJT41406.1 DUF4400 domain-containing protein [Aeromonas media]QLI59206.1 DUF4400 domain-containing protein [Aeromonas caviae]QLI60435.1 DUF4400 domain-containing protein [Aeromonas caviae]HDN9374639.1 DUF4400 domain-containing protein [Aeromonas salmonicida]